MFFFINLKRPNYDTVKTVWCERFLFFKLRFPRVRWVENTNNSCVRIASVSGRHIFLFLLFYSFNIYFFFFYQDRFYSKSKRTRTSLACTHHIFKVHCVRRRFVCKQESIKPNAKKNKIKRERTGIAVAYIILYLRVSFFSFGFLIFFFFF